jgi:N-acetyl sugar amidotransferase
MDTTAAGITFGPGGECNYCTDFLAVLGTYQKPSRAEQEAHLAEFVARVKRDGAGKEYDCIVGLSGGADSAYTLYTARKLGLRPLAVHMDNGWDSELAAHNIANLVRHLEVDLHTNVIDWEEYRGLMQAFFDADVIDVELLYDNAMTALNYQQAAQYGVRWILAGTNTTTEGMRIPSNWNWFKLDRRNITRIARKLAGLSLHTFPSIGTLGFARYRRINRISWVSFLDFLDYRKSECVQTLVDELGYRPYPYKHYESVFTRFYQGYILPTKFHVDKRRLHLSTLVCSGQMTRAAALDDLGHSPYPSEALLHEDREYFLKKMGWTRSQLDAYLARPEVPHAAYGSEKPFFDWASGLYRNTVRRLVSRSG